MSRAGEVVNVSGRVLRSDRTSEGIPEVTVSDGLTVAKTNSAGRYSLSIDPARRHTGVVFITVPSGWRAPLHATGTPMFYRVVDLGNGPVDDIDFVLHAESVVDPSEYRFVALADVHVQAGTVNTKESYARQLEQINSLADEVTDGLGPPRFITVAGDVTNDATPAEFRDYVAASAASDIPVWTAPGNHDLVGRESGGPYPAAAQNVPYRDAIDGYRRALGPEWYSFQHGTSHFVVLENYWGLKERDQLAWLERDLSLNAAGKHVVVVTHVPWNVPQTPAPTYTSAFRQLLERYDVRLLLAGHTHANDVAPGVVGDAMQAVTTSAAHTLDQTPRGFRMVEFRDGSVVAPYWELDAHRSPTVVYPLGRVPPRSHVRVNRYSPPGVTTEAEYRVSAGEWQPLRLAGRRSWTAELDADGAAVGEPQRLDVRVRDHGYGAWAEASSTFETVARGPAIPRQGTPWPMFHADAARSGVGADAVAPPLSLAWARHSAGSILTSSPVVDHDTVYIGVRDEDGWDGSGVLAVDLPSGSIRWKAVSEGSVEATVAVAGDVVIAPSVRGPLRGLDSATGCTRWEWAPDQYCWMYFSPAVVDETVYQAYNTPDGTWVVALNAHTGEPKWQSAEPVGRNWISYGSPTVAGDKLLFATAYANLVALDISTGSVCWQSALGAGLGVHAAPVAAGDAVILACKPDLLVCADISDGGRRWAYTSEGDPLLPGRSTGATPAVADGLVYAGFTDGDVAGLRLETGERVWQHRTDGAVLSAPAVSGDTVYVGSNDGRLRALDRMTGEHRWSYDLGAWVASSPAVTGNAVVVAAWDGNVYAFTGGDGGLG